MPPPGPFVLFRTYVVLAAPRKGRSEMSQSDPPGRTTVVTPSSRVRHDAPASCAPVLGVPSAFGRAFDNALRTTLDARTTDGSLR